MTIECDEDNMDHFTFDLLPYLEDIVGSFDLVYDYDWETLIKGRFFGGYILSPLKDYSKMISEECKAKVNLTCYDGYGNYLSFSFKNGKVA